MKFQTRPHEIDAYQVPATVPGEVTEMLRTMPAWLVGAMEKKACVITEKPSSDYLHIDVHTVREVTTARPGDWIVRWDDGPVRVMPDSSFATMCRYHGYFPAPDHLLIEQALCMINTERRRQIEVEGRTPEHDDNHEDSELAWLACYYAMPCPIRVDGVIVTPRDIFSETAWSPDDAKRESKSRIQQLVVAGACISAELARHLRARAKDRTEGA